MGVSYKNREFSRHEWDLTEALIHTMNTNPCPGCCYLSPQSLRGVFTPLTFLNPIVVAAWVPIKPKMCKILFQF